MRNILMPVIQYFASTEFLKSLVPEAIGILITVFVMDRLIKKNESGKWALSRHLFYAQLLAALNAFVERDIGFPGGTSTIWMFGDTPVFGSDPGSVDATKLRDWLQTQWTTDGLLNRPIRLDGFTALKSIVMSTIDKGMYILGPDATNLVVRVESEITQFLVLTDPNRHQSAIDRVWGVLVPVVELKNFLEGSAKERLTADEWRSRFVKPTGRKLP